MKNAPARARRSGRRPAPSRGCRAASRARRATCRRRRTSPSRFDRQVVQVRLDEAGVGDAEVGRELAGEADGRRREVGAGHPARRGAPTTGCRCRSGTGGGAASGRGRRRRPRSRRRAAGCRRPGSRRGRRTSPSAWTAVQASQRAGWRRTTRRGRVAGGSGHLRATTRRRRPAPRSATRQNATTWPASSRIHGFSSRGRAPISSSRRSIQRPATASSAAVREAGDGADPGRVDPFDGRAPVVRRRRARSGRR